MAAVVVIVVVFAIVVVLATAASGVRRAAAQAAWVSVPQEPSDSTDGFAADEPLEGFKAAQVLFSVDGAMVRLSGITMGSDYGPDDTAACTRGCRPPPGEGCVCGFYAFNERTAAAALIGVAPGGAGVRPVALLTVDLHGVVLEYEKGFRAQRQTVVEVAISGACDRCAGLGNHGVPATRMAAAPSYVPRSLLGWGPPTRRYPSGFLPARPVCDLHVPDEPAAVVMSPLRMQTLLGVPCRLT